jgi:histidine triad (HIT) family protein
MDSSKDCLFCRIIQGAKEADFVYKGETVVAFNDIRHALIFELIFRAKEMAKSKGIDRSGYHLVFNVERGGGQHIFHLHLHLIGGW